MYVYVTEKSRKGIEPLLRTKVLIDLPLSLINKHLTFTLWSFYNTFQRCIHFGFWIFTNTKVKEIVNVFYPKQPEMSF